MKIAIPKETRPGERRVAATPDTVKRLRGHEAEVVVETGAGTLASISDEAYRDAGAVVAASAAEVAADATLVLRVTRPEGPEQVGILPPDSLLVAFLQPHGEREGLRRLAEQGVTAFAVEMIPRISRAQSMDALSSQANLAGYKAVVDAAGVLTKAMPMMMTAAGTVAPAKVLVLGAGVAGLQAIATARRLGAVVSAFDVRPQVREQVESLGGRFVEVEGGRNAETAGGYAKEMDEDYRRRQQERIHDIARSQDIIITTALIPGRSAPVLVPEETVRAMAPGAVIVDLAAEAGGNCALYEPGHVVVHDGVTILGPTHLPSTLARDASALYARNLFHFAEPILANGGTVPWDDEVMAQSVVTRDGSLVHPAIAEKAAND